MKKGICPRCGSKEIFNGSNVANKSGMHDSNAIPVSFFRSAALDNFVCGQCGYVESYIAKEKDLAAIKAKWPLVI
jgi:predicted nucleic-acid-binding Zn-ribbon protein